MSPVEFKERSMSCQCNAPCRMSILRNGCRNDEFKVQGPQVSFSKIHVFGTSLCSF